jgi:transposase-like protein
MLDEILENYKSLEDMAGQEGIIKQLIEQAMEAELTEQLGYEKSD